MDLFLRFLWLIPLGFFAGAYGTLIGAGGGFVLTPVLLLLYPGEAPETITSISLTVVFFNALSGTLAYASTKRIDYKFGTIFALAGIPGAVLGAFATTAVSREWFDLLFGLVLLCVAIFLTLTTGREGPGQADQDKIPLSGFNPPTLVLGSLFSSGLGFISSFLGIGGGFIYVPVFMFFLRLPVHVATATSLYVLTINALAGTTTHIAAGLFHHGLRRALALSLGAVLGAQAGAKLSQRIHGDWIIRSLAVALGLVGGRLIATSLW